VVWSIGSAVRTTVHSGRAKCAIRSSSVCSFKPGSVQQRFPRCKSTNRFRHPLKQGINAFHLHELYLAGGGARPQLKLDE